MGTTQTGRSFYVGMGVALILLSFLGFGPFMYERFATGGEMSPMLAMHGVLFFGWLVLYTYQASLVRARNLRKHMVLGKASIALAIAMAVVSVVVTGEVFARGESSATPFSPEQFVMLPLMDITLFVVYYSLAVLNRKVPETHKRLMLLVGIMMMDPATGRLGLTLGFAPIGLLFHFGLIAALCVYDQRTLGRVHKVSLIAGLVLAARYVAFFAIGPTEAWASFARMLLG
ncbi:hypothetical protein ACFO5Q_14110 [Kordiimonas lipolytica]|uniref:Uncharacterized protein n=1 Tax=Kordiimonas lipolytica TaxID=1662421 RepID=A0ABV8UCQ6_9PROT|nr:hypothetical protein [Kordiimonas lipolytica]